MLQTLKKVSIYFIQGLLGLLPLIVSVYIVLIILRLARGIVGISLFFIPVHLRTDSSLFIFIELVAAIAIFLSVAGIGYAIRTVAGKFLLGQIDHLLNTIPVLNSIYRTTRQLIDIFAVDKTERMMKPVLIDWPSEGRQAIGFITGTYTPGIDGKKMITVFTPTTPNPTSGFLLFLPPEKIHNLDVSFETAMKMVLTAGMVNS
jgi:uncharacterized membrane protein